jgi:PEP-CTERM motif-containing protein
MYLAGFNAAGAAADVGIVEVIDPLGTVSFGTAFGVINTADTFAYTGVAFDGSTVAASYDNGVDNANGIQAFDADGTLRWKVGDTSGNFRGMSGVAMDPGFGGADSGVASQTWGSGRRWLWDDTTGANLYDGSNGLITYVNTSAWRSLDIASNGDMYYRGQNDLFKVERTAGNDGNRSMIVDLVDAPWIIGQNVGVIEDGANTMVIYNDRTGWGGVPFASGVNLALADGTAEPLNVSWLGGAAPVDGNGVYDFDWDPQTQTLAIMDFGNRTVHILAIPEPASLGLLGLGGLALLGRRRDR